MKKSVYKKTCELVFGGDCHRLRTSFRRITNFMLPLFFPFKKNRDVAREKIDSFLIEMHKGKIQKFLRDYPKVRNESETIDRIVKGSLSISRFGDGEFNICIGRSIGFQKRNTILAVRLKEILASKNEKILIAINTLPIASELTPIWNKFIIRRGDRVTQLFDTGRLYDSSTITTTFPSDEKLLDQRAQSLKRIWDNRKVIFVVGKNSRFFLCEDLFDNIKEQKFIYAPAKNAFDDYDNILKEVSSNSKEWLIMISLGPTATVLSYDLSELGFQAIDLGHMPSKYYLQKYGRLYPEGYNLK